MLVNKVFEVSSKIVLKMKKQSKKKKNEKIP